MQVYDLLNYYLVISKEIAVIDWTFNNELKWSKKLEKVVEFYLFNTPVDNISARGKTFKQLGWDKRKLTPLLKREIKFLSSNWIVTTNKDIEMQLKNKSQFQSVKFEEMAIHIINKNTNIDSFFYAIRCAIAHGSLSIRKYKNINYYILENKDRGKIKSRIVIKEENLLAIINIVPTSKKYNN